MSTTAEQIAANDAAGLRDGKHDALEGDETSVQEARDALDAAEAAETEPQAPPASDLDTEQDELDADPSRMVPDRPEGAADEDDPLSIAEAAALGEPGYPQPEDERPLAERLREASGISDDEAKARGEQAEDAGGTPGELPGMPERKINSKVGGAAPTISEFKIAGRSIELGGGTQFVKGAKITATVELELHQLSFVDKHDKETGQITDTVRRHHFKIVGYELEDVG